MRRPPYVVPDVDTLRSSSIVKVNCDGFRDLLPYVAEILPLRRDAAAVRIIPRGHQPARPFVTLNLKGDFFHCLKLIIAYVRSNISW
jgi:hypothetical protein